MRSINQKTPHFNKAAFFILALTGWYQSELPPDPGRLNQKVLPSPCTLSNPTSPPI
jgi:hypothetical protein